MGPRTVAPPARRPGDHPARRLVVATLAVALLAGLVGCDLSRVGRRCRGGVARDATHLLVCRGGRWARSITLAQVGRILADAAANPAPVLDVTTVAGGLVRPWDLAFLPDGSFLVTERPGRLVAFSGGGRRVVAAPADVEAVGEGGLMGLAVDPAFDSNRRIYVCLRSRAGGGSDVRVVRFELDAAITNAGARADIVTGIPAGENHVGCRLEFGPDAMLWITTGDALRGPAPQDPAGLAGKVLRVTTDGAPAPGNPGGPLDPRIFSLGHRNPQGLAFRSAPGGTEDGRPYSVEHGPDRDDEINRVVAGGNYGWNPVPAGGGTAYTQTVPMTDGVRVPGAIGAVWSSGRPTIAPAGATFLTGGRWGSWEGALAVAVLKGTRLLVLRLSADGTRVEREWTAVTDRGRLRAATMGPDGALYLTTDADAGAVLRVAPR